LGRVVLNEPKKLDNIKGGGRSVKADKRRNQRNSAYTSIGLKARKTGAPGRNLLPKDTGETIKGA